VVGTLTANGVADYGAPAVDAGHYLPIAYASSDGIVRPLNDVMSTLDSAGESRGTNQQRFVQQEIAVRRLTPRECERLQGFPDDYTAIPGAADGPRYKACGNSMAVPVMHWIGKRIFEKIKNNC
jgi:DNA (cytosine-5)-methyltransferase 1